MMHHNQSVASTIRAITHLPGIDNLRVERRSGDLPSVPEDSDVEEADLARSEGHQVPARGLLLHTGLGHAVRTVNLHLGQGRGERLGTNDSRQGGLVISVWRDEQNTRIGGTYMLKVREEKEQRRKFKRRKGC